MRRGRVTASQAVVPDSIPVGWEFLISPWNWNSLLFQNTADCEGICIVGGDSFVGLNLSAPSVLLPAYTGTGISHLIFTILYHITTPTHTHVLT